MSYVGALQKICPFSDDFFSKSTLILTTISMKECMDIGARPYVLAVLLIYSIFLLTLADGLCFAWFI
jgi:hypothetical protein